ncbi:Uncharacterised protein [Arthrobacter agilis]|uniref:hypothetical protein n=1 Tax=Arthrobacter agilis TaxID=37921 RepID=UPI000B54AB0C|nr:hypothetical protein [Arthrobacter agilis]OUM44553.1 hypothetical protein B8W74_03590 [Arthrobacter agilis]VDR31996.1 Uncharacterised protein [Arthrobacter agilis]
MENQPDHEYQRTHLLRAIRHAQIEASELWLHYFGLGGDAGEYEVEAYLHGSFTLPPLQRDLLAHAANELIDRLPPPPRAPYSTDPAGGSEALTEDNPVPARAARPEDAAADTPLDWLFTDTDGQADAGSTDADDGPRES